MYAAASDAGAASEEAEGALTCGSRLRNPLLPPSGGEDR